MGQVEEVDGQVESFAERAGPDQAGDTAQRSGNLQTVVCYLMLFKLSIVALRFLLEILNLLKLLEEERLERSESAEVKRVEKYLLLRK